MRPEDVVVPPEVEAEWDAQLEAYARALQAELDSYFNVKPSRKYTTIADIVKTQFPTVADVLKAYDPEEKRDEGGEWTEGGGAAKKPSEPPGDADLQEHTRTVLAECEAPAKTLQANLAAMFTGATFKVRVKKLKSTVEKSLKDAKPPEKMGDLIGARVTYPDVAGVYAAARTFANKTPYAIKEQRDYITKPLGFGYRSIHFLITVDGKPAEVQFRTPNQTKWADWSHEQIYKLHSQNHQAVVEHRAEIERYAAKVSECYYEEDCGKHGSFPPCESIIRATVGCLDEQS